jgi:hypothetical protein
MNTVIASKSLWPTENHWKELRDERNAIKELLMPKKKPKKPEQKVFNDESYEDAMQRIINQFKGQL